MSTVSHERHAPARKQPFNGLGSLTSGQTLPQERQTADVATPSAPRPSCCPVRRGCRPRGCRRRASPAILAAAVSRPPLITAPAWPMRRPGGAVAPAMKPTVGFFTGWRARNSAASISLWPPISPIMMICFGFVIGEEHVQDFDEVGALHRVAADADAGALAEARGGGLRHRLVGQRAGARDDADACRGGGCGRA